MFVNWDSQSLSAWTARHASGNIVSLEGNQTHYLAAGNGIPVILIHGFFFDSILWLHNIASLAEYSRVYAMDLWGFGYSTRDPGRPDYELYSKQLIAFMDHLGIKKAILVGHSFGGGVAIHFSAQYPARVEKVVLVAAAGLPNPEPLSARFFMLPGVGELMLRLPSNMVRKKMLGDFFLYKPDMLSKDVYEKLMQFHKIKKTIPFMLKFMRRHFADRLESFISELAKHKLPVQIVWGKNDRAIPLRLGQKLHELLPGSIFSVIDQAGHVPNLEQPEVFNACVRNFIFKPAPMPGPDDIRNA